MLITLLDEFTIGTRHLEAQMRRIQSFGMRMNSSERQLLHTVAQRLERTESDLIRWLIREKARELGVLPVVRKKEGAVVSASL
jgi:hypothetical protein